MSEITILHSARFRHCFSLHQKHIGISHQRYVQVSGGVISVGIEMYILWVAVGIHVFVKLEVRPEIRRIVFSWLTKKAEFITKF